MTAAEPFNVHAALRRRFSQPEFAILFEVRNQTGFSRQIRTADALVMGMYPSRGNEIIGIEIKNSRRDWLQELKNHAKADEIFRFCDRWYLACADDMICQHGELPKPWGLLIPKGGNLYEDIPAPRLKPKPLTREFVASIMRNANRNCLDEKAIQAASSIAVENYRKRRDADEESSRARKERVHTELLEAVVAFEKASGLQLRDVWNAPKIGAIVRLIMEGGTKNMQRDLEHLHSTAERIAAVTKEILDKNPWLESGFTKSSPPSKTGKDATSSTG